MSTPTVISLQLHQDGGQPLQPVAQARALPDLGLEGDSHSLLGPGRKRQVLILDISTADHLGLRPGDLREQITIRGLPDVTTLPSGARLHIGEAIFEAASECAPCLHIGDMLGVEDAELFRQALQHRRGLLCRVVEVRGGGLVRVGDAVEIAG